VPENLAVRAVLAGAVVLAGGDVRHVRHFSRHTNIETLLRYDDNRPDEAGDGAGLFGQDAG
jgi:hypothetical protein